MGDGVSEVKTPCLRDLQPLYTSYRLEVAQLKMKITIWGGCFIVLCVLFVTLVGIIEKKQTAVKPKEDIPLSIEQLEKDHVKSTAFEDIMKTDIFGEIKRMALETFGCVDTELSDGSYFYDDSGFITEILNIFEKHPYYMNNTQPEEDTDTYWDLEFEGTKGKVFSCAGFEVKGSEDVICVWFVCKDLAGNVQRDFEDIYMITDSSVVEELFGCIEENTHRMTLELAMSRLENAGPKLPLETFLSHEHKLEERVNFSSSKGDCYNIFTQSLEDSEKYLKIYAEITEGSDVKKYFIFKIELYDEQGNLEKELYSDMESFHGEM